MSTLAVPIATTTWNIDPTHTTERFDRQITQPIAVIFSEQPRACERREIFEVLATTHTRLAQLDRRDLE